MYNFTRLSNDERRIIFENTASKMEHKLNVL